MKAVYWKSKGEALWQGVRDICKAFLFLDRQRGYYFLPLRPTTVFLVLLATGLARNFLEVVLLRSIPEPDRWYSLKPEIQFAVCFWPFQVCYLGAGVAFVLGSIFGRAMDRGKLVSLFFYLQVLHIIAPFFDWMGNVCLGMRYVFLAPPDAVTDFYAWTSKMLAGDFVMAAFLLVIPYRLLVRDFGLNRLQSAAIPFAVLNLLYWPNVHFFSTFNMMFKYCTGLWHAHWIGWGLYSLAAGCLGCVLLNVDKLLPSLGRKARPQ